MFSVRKATGAMLIAFAGAGAHAEPASFDLTCQGVHKVLVPKSEAEERPVTFRLRVDLASEQFCSDPCEEVRRFVEITDSRLVLDDDPMWTARSMLPSVQTSINRQTGAYSALFTSPGPVAWETVATCEPAPFSGFPARKF